MSPTLAVDTDSDPRIISLVRQGVTEAFDVLYQRHLQVAEYVARAQTDNPSDADDVVAESFATVFQLLKEGKGPSEFFRSYLLTVVRRTAHDRNRKARRTPTTADDAFLDLAVVDDDHVIRGLESSLMAKAFKSLPERWQAVLWHVDIEGLKPAAAAPLIGLTPNGISSLALRAREGLRQAYLQQHISHTVDQACDEYASQLGKYARNALKRTSEEKVRHHLESCSKCTALLIELNDIETGMRAVLFPLVTGLTFTPGVAAAISGAAAAGSPSGAGSTGVAEKLASEGTRTVSKVWQPVAAAVVGAVALAGILVWFLQSDSGSESVVAGDPATNTPAPPAQESPSPIPTPAPSTDSPSVPSAEPPLAAVPQVPAVVVPPAPLPQRSAAVVDSGSVYSMANPQLPQSGTPQTQTVNATFSAVSGSNPSERELRVQFSLQEDGTPTTGEAVFMLPDQATFVAGRTVAPAGWTCGSEASDARQVRCTTAALNSEDLAFSVGVAMPAAAEDGTLNYQFGGRNIVTKTFTNTFR